MLKGGMSQLLPVHCGKKGSSGISGRLMTSATTVERNLN
jgi:hypothetical protein